MEENEIIDVEETQEIQENKPTLAKGNYIIEITSNGKVIKKVAIANAEVNINKIADGGMAIDL